MDDFASDFGYLNNIRDAQMFQRAPRRKFERLDPFEYFDGAEFEDAFRFTKEEMRRWSQCWTEKAIRNDITKHSNIIMRVQPLEKNLVLFSKIRWLEVRYANAPINVFPQRGCGADRYPGD